MRTTRLQPLRGECWQHHVVRCRTSTNKFVSFSVESFYCPDIVGQAMNGLTQMPNRRPSFLCPDSHYESDFSLISLALWVWLPLLVCFHLWVWLLVLILVSHYFSGFCVNCTLYMLCNTESVLQGLDIWCIAVSIPWTNHWNQFEINDPESRSPCGSMWFCVVLCGSGGMHRLCIPRPSDRDRTHSLCRHAGRSFSNKNILVVGANIVRTWENLIDWTSAIPKPDGRKSEFCLITKRF